MNLCGWVVLVICTAYIQIELCHVVRFNELNGSLFDCCNDDDQLEYPKYSATGTGGC